MEWTHFPTMIIEDFEGKYLKNVSNYIHYYHKIFFTGLQVCFIIIPVQV